MSQIKCPECAKYVTPISEQLPTHGPGKKGLLFCDGSGMSAAEVAAVEPEPALGCLVEFQAPDPLSGATVTFDGEITHVARNGRLTIQTDEQKFRGIDPAGVFVTRLGE